MRNSNLSKPFSAGFSAGSSAILNSSNEEVYNLGGKVVKW